MAEEEVQQAQQNIQQHQQNLRSQTPRCGDGICDNIEKNRGICHADCR